MMISFFLLLFYFLNYILLSWSCMQNSYCMVYLSHSSTHPTKRKWMKYQPHECLLRDVGDYTANMRCGCWNCTNIDNLERKKKREWKCKWWTCSCTRHFFFFIQANIITKYKNVIIYSQNKIERRSKKRKTDIRMHTKNGMMWIKWSTIT